MLLRLNQLTVHDLLRWGLYAMVVLIPWVYSNHFESAFTVPKLTVLRTITLALAGVGMLQILLEGKLRWRRSPMNRWIGAYAAVLCLTTLTSAYFWVSFFGDEHRFLGLVTWLNLLFVMALAIQVFQERKEVLHLVHLSVINAVALGVYGLFQWKGTSESTFRVFGTFGHSNHFGAYLGFHLLLLMALFFRSPHPISKGLYALGAIPLGMTIVATASRGALGATLLAMVIFSIGLVARQWTWVAQRRKKLGIAAGILLGLAVVLGYSLNLGERMLHLPVVQRTLETAAFVEGGNLPDRVSWWLSAFEMWKEHPVLGSGLSTFHSLYNLYRRTDYRVPGDIQDTFTPEAVHMEYFDIAATQGLVGIVVYLGMVVCWLRLLWKLLKDERGRMQDKMLALGFLGAGSVYFFQILLSFGVVATLVPLCLMMGASIAFYHIVSDPKPQTEQFAVFSLRGGGRLAVFMVAGVLWFFSAWFTYRQGAADRFLDRALELQGQKEVAAAIQAYESAVHNMPWMTTYWEAYGQGTFEFTEYTEEPEILTYLFETSLSAHRIATHQIPTLPHLPANLAITELTYADFLENQRRITEAEHVREQGLAHYAEAVAVAVNNPLFAYNEGLILISVERYEKALQSFMKALSIRDPYKETSYHIAWLATELKDYETARTYIQKALAETPGEEKVKILLQRINSESSS